MPRYPHRQAYNVTAGHYITRKRKQWKYPPEYPLTLASFTKLHRDADQRVTRYTSTNRRGYAQLDGWAETMMAPQAAHYHYANNVESRIALAALMVKHALPFLRAHQGPFLLVTVASTAYILPREEAGGVNIFSLQQLTRQALQGCDFVGMVEPGLYKNWGSDGPLLGHSAVSWHTHAVVAGKSKAEAKVLAQNVGERHANITGHAAVHIKSIKTKAELEHYLLYISKTPLKEYRLRASQSDSADPETGEVFLRYRQSKRPMRPGDRVRLANALNEVLLDDLLFGTGAGRSIVATIKYEALTKYEREEAARERQQSARKAASDSPVRRNR